MVDYGTVSRTARRAPPRALAAARTSFRWLSAVSPRLAAATAARLYSIPGRKGHTEREQEVLSRGNRMTVGVGGHRIAAWRWGAGPTVLLSHGWGGRAGQVASLVDPLVAAGFSAVAFDHPGHGQSSGIKTNMPEIARVMRELSLELGPVHGVIGHSLGAAASALAVSEGLAVAAVVLIAPPEDMKYFSAVYARVLELSDDVLELMNRRLVGSVGRDWSELRAAAISRGRTTPLLVVHDRDDPDVPHAHGAAWAREWPGAELMTTSGLGHKELLWDQEVLARAAKFVERHAADHRVARAIG